MKSIWRRWWFWVIAVAAVVVVGWFAADWLTPVYPVRISRETTYLTGPLRPDGTVDYLAAVNAEWSEGVTPENNAAPLFWQAFGPEFLPERTRDQAMQILGLPSLPAEGDYFQSWRDFIQPSSDDDLAESATRPAVVELGESERNVLYEQYVAALSRPWSAQEFPMVAKWLEANAGPLALIAEASRRSHLYVPYLAYGGNVSGNLAAAALPSLSRLRASARALAIRAMFRLNEGDIDGAWGDVMTCYGMARLVASHPSMIGRLVGIAIEHIANDAAVAMAVSGKLSADQARRMQAELAQLPPLPPILEAIYKGERYQALDIITAISRRGLGDGAFYSPDLGVVPTSDDGREETQPKPEKGIDWNSAMIEVNGIFDRYQQIASLPTTRQRLEAMKQLSDDVRRRREKFNEKFEKNAIERLVGKVQEFVGYDDDSRELRKTKKMARQDPAGLIICVFVPSLGRAQELAERTAEGRELAQVALALAAYRADHGRYPAVLAELQPTYMKEIPDDPFSEKPLIYKSDGTGYRLYSVGVNLTDDGGTTRDEAGRSDERDLVVKTPAEEK